MAVKSIIGLLALLVFQQALPPGWSTVRVGNTGLHVDLPGQLSRPEPETFGPDEKLIASAEYRTLEDEYLFVQVTTFQLRTGVQPSTSTMETVMNDLTNIELEGMGKPNVDAKNAVKIGGKDALRVKMIYPSGRVNLVVLATIIGDGRSLYAVLVGYFDDEPAAAINADRIHKSVRWQTGG